MEGLYAIITRLMQNPNERMVIDEELSIYNHSNGLFANESTIRNRYKKSPYIMTYFKFITFML